MHNKQALILQILVQKTERACSCTHCDTSHCGSTLERNMQLHTLCYLSLWGYTREEHAAAHTVLPLTVGVH